MCRNPFTVFPKKFDNIFVHHRISGTSSFRYLINFIVLYVFYGFVAIVVVVVFCSITFVEFFYLASPKGKS